MNGNLIEARDLTKDYDREVRALDRVSFEVAPGEWVAVVGPSGSGKTTLLNLIACLDRPTGGWLVVDGQDVARLGSGDLARFRREKVGLVFQQFHLIPYLTALENVMLAQYFHSMADEAEAREALEGVGLGHRLQHLPRQLSGGEQQRVCIARALVNQPRIILADEPTGNLDRANEDIVISLFRGLHAEGHTILLATHDATLARLADRVLGLDHGRMAATGPAVTERSGLGP